MIPDPRLAVPIGILSYVLFLWALSTSAVLTLVISITLIIAIVFYIGGCEMWERFVVAVKQIDKWLDSACIYLRDN